MTNLETDQQKEDSFRFVLFQTDLLKKAGFKQIEILVAAYIVIKELFLDNLIFYLNQ